MQAKIKPGLLALPLGCLIALGAPVGLPLGWDGHSAMAQDDDDGGEDDGDRRSGSRSSDDRSPWSRPKATREPPLSRPAPSSGRPLRQSWSWQG